MKKSTREDTLVFYNKLRHDSRMFLIADMLEEWVKQLKKKMNLKEVEVPSYFAQCGTRKACHNAVYKWIARISQNLSNGIHFKYCSITYKLTTTFSSVRCSDHQVSAKDSVKVTTIMNMMSKDILFYDLW